MGKLENKFQAELKSELKLLFPNCIITKNDPEMLQGIPDLTIIYKGKYAFLECKKEKNASRRPNQDYYIGYGQKFAFGEFIEPSNKKEVLERLYNYFMN